MKTEIPHTRIGIAKQCIFATRHWIDFGLVVEVTSIVIEINRLLS